jgi:Glyoxalase-like domain
MTTGIADIDHLMISVKDSEAAGALFERMGFTATPHSLMPGLSNRLICFPSQQRGACNFVELMTLEDVDTAPALMPLILLPPGRPVSMVMVAPDIDKTHDALRGQGLNMPPPLHLERDWALPGGEVITPRFAVLIPDPGQSPFYWNVCQHKTPEHYVRPDFVHHENGAKALTAVIAVADKPGPLADHYRERWGAEVIGNGPVRVRLGAVELRVYGRAALEEAFPRIAPVANGDRLVGFAVSCSDPDKITRDLKRNGFNPLGDGDTRYLMPAETEGSLVVFETADD